MIHWIYHLACPFNLIAAAVMAFPRMLGLHGAPCYAYAVIFLAFAFIYGFEDYKRNSKARDTKVSTSLVRRFTEVEVEWRFCGTDRAGRMCRSLDGCDLIESRMVREIACQCHAETGALHKAPTRPTTTTAL
jgi:hypothetical protein